MKEDQEFKASLSYANSRQAWAIRDPVFKKIKQVNPECSKSKESGWSFIFLKERGRESAPRTPYPFQHPLP